MEYLESSAIGCQTVNVEENLGSPVIIDLFAGVGGLSLGAARAGFKVALAVELDDHALAAHKKNFPNVKHLQKDIAKITPEELLASAGLAKGQLDGLIGGPPCQGFSHMGRRSVTDPRNNLFKKFFEFVDGCRPKFYVAENVLGILDVDYDEIREKAFQVVCDTGAYEMLPPLRIKASEFGAPTVRERVFFVGYRKDAMKLVTHADFKARKTALTVTVHEALKGLPVAIRDEWITEAQSWRKVETAKDTVFHRKIQGEIPNGIGDVTAIDRYHKENVVSGCFGTRHTDAVRARYAALKPGQQDKISKSIRLKKDGLCPTLRAGTGADKGSYQAVRPIHPSCARVITPREAARLQGFPDWFQFAPSKWHSFRQIGNSVSPLVAEIVLTVVLSKLNQEYGQNKKAAKSQSR
jgi:DNA (cytosine-5)-methyltransferase 1